MKLVITLKPKKTVTKINKESLTTKRSLILIGLSAACGGYLLFLAVLAPQQLAEATTAATNVVCNGCVGSGDIADSTIQSVDIRNGHVANADIATDAVTSGKILNGQVGSADIGTGQVGSADIGTGQVGSVDIGDGQVAAGDIANDAVTTDKISDTNGVFSVDIVDGQVASADILDNTITPADIAQIFIFRVQGDTVTVAPGTAGTAIANCPEGGQLLTGGGFGSGIDIDVFQNRPDDRDTWKVIGINQGTTDAPLIAHALCV
jgi:hypothetical protein